MYKKKNFISFLVKTLLNIFKIWLNINEIIISLPRNLFFSLQRFLTNVWISKIYNSLTVNKVRVMDLIFCVS